MTAAASGSLRNTLWIIGAVLMVQGFGSALTEAVWHSSFGVSGILIGGFGAPAWVSWAIGAAGTALLAWAAVLATRR